MKTLMINPPQTFYPRSSLVSESVPLGILYIAAVLERENYEVEILDTLIADSCLRIEGDTRQYGLPWEKIAEEIDARKPSVVGITNPFTAQIDNTVKTAEIVKAIDREIVTIVGGPHFSAIDLVQFLRNTPSVDIVVVGEGEYTMLDIVRHLDGDREMGSIDGIAYRKGNTAVVNHPRAFAPELDALPFPAYHLVDMGKYMDPKTVTYRGVRHGRDFPIISSRGCPFNCVFCSIHLHMGKKWRAHSRDYVIAHIEHLVNKYGTEHLHFEDDNLTLDMRRFEGILDDLIAKNVPISWDTPNGIRADGLSIGILRKMKATGCAHLTIGVESGDQWVLDHVIDKNLALDDVVNVAKMCKEVGIKLSAFYVIGFPGEKKENMQKTIEFALGLKRQYNTGMHIFRATPLCGTRLHEICQDKGYLTDDLTPRALSEATPYWGQGLIGTEDFTPEEVGRLASSAFSTYDRLLLIDHLRHPVDTVKAVIRHPRAVIPVLKSLARRSR